MWKDILFVTTRTQGDDAALTAATALALHQKAHLAVLVTVEMPIPIPSEWGAYPTGFYTDLYDESRTRGESLADRLKARLAQTDVSAEVRLVDALLRPPSRVAAMHARHADLAVMTGAANDDERMAVSPLFLDLLMDGGRPVLLVPPLPTAVLPPERAVIAWQPTREASRALHDALPLLRAAKQIDVLVIDPSVGEVGHGEEPGADIAAHLTHHGLNVRVVAKPKMGLSVAAAILRHATDIGAGLLVAGGYSHSRFREQIMGGVTRELLVGAHLPILFSH